MGEKQDDIILKVDHLTKTFQVKSPRLFEKPLALNAVNDVSFEVKRGETIGVIGESGCGKSTLGKAILQLIPATSGDVINNGQSMMKLNQKERVIELLKLVGLDYYHSIRYPHEFSGGQRQRINIARALSMDIKLLVCDEPVSALDVSVQAQVLNLLKKLKDELGLTYIFISQDLSVVKYISDRIIIMYLGRIMEIGDAKEIYANPAHPYTKALFSAIPPVSPYEKKETIELKGEIPSPLNMPPGCPFGNRCPFCTDVCKQSVPELKAIGDNHEVACVRYQKGEIS